MPPARTPRAMNAITSRPSIAISTQSVLLVSSSGGAEPPGCRAPSWRRSWCRRWLQSSWRPRTSRRGQRRRRALRRRAGRLRSRARGEAPHGCSSCRIVHLSLAQRLLEVGVEVGDLLEGSAARPATARACPTRSRAPRIAAVVLSGPGSIVARGAEPSFVSWAQSIRSCDACSPPSASGMPARLQALLQRQVGRLDRTGDRGADEDRPLDRVAGAAVVRAGRSRSPCGPRRRSPRSAPPRRRSCRRRPRPSSTPARSRRCCRRPRPCRSGTASRQSADDCDDERDQASHRAAAAGREISSSVPTSSFQRSTVGTLTRSSGECGFDLRPNESMSSGCADLPPITALSRPAWDRGHDRLLAEHSLEDACGDRQHGRVEVGPPGAVVAFSPRARRRPARLRLRSAAITSASSAPFECPREAVQRQLRLGRGLAEGGAQLHESVEVGAHRERPGRTSASTESMRASRPRATRRRAGRRLVTGHVDAGIGRLVGIAD